MGAGFNYFSRKIHRYFGVFIGIQFLFWTVGGLYFSWTNIEEIRGEHLRKEEADLTSFEDLIDPQLAIANLKKSKKAAKIVKFELTEVSHRPFYEITYSDAKGSQTNILIDAKSGIHTDQISKEDAMKIALEAVVKKSNVKNAVLLNEKDVGGHHEYRGSPLPAYAVTFEEPADLTVYVSAKNGKVVSFRTNQWRVFDFFWMLHTMDFIGRDDINNYILRIFSVLGLITIISGFVLFYITSPAFRQKNNK